MAGLDPTIHVLEAEISTLTKSLVLVGLYDDWSDLGLVIEPGRWMAGTSPATTIESEAH